MRLIAKSKQWPKNKRLIDPLTKKIYYPELQEIEMEREIEISKTNKKGQEVLVSETVTVKEEMAVYDVDSIYGQHLMEANPLTFLVVKESKKKEAADKKAEAALPEYHKMAYNDLLKFYKVTTGEEAFGMKREAMISELDGFFAKKE